MAVKLRQSVPFHRLLQATIGNFLELRYGLRSENTEIFGRIPPPFAVFANHVSFWDPFFIANFVPQPVCYVTSDLPFRNPFLRFLLSLVGAIPKTKSVSDFETVRNIFRVKQQKGIIGIFPEGLRNWDGHTVPPLLTSAKLIKALKVPVIIPILKGAFLSLPRWSAGPRKGRVIVDFREGFTAEEVKSSSVEEIYERLSRLMDYNEWDFQRDSMIRYRSRHRAERLELTLFTCPECLAFGTLRSRKDRLACSQCGHEVRYTEYGFFEQDDGKPRFETIREWNLWQIEHVHSVVEKARESASEECLIQDHPVWIYLGARRQAVKRFRIGALKLYIDRIELDTLSGERLQFPLDKIVGVNVQIHEVLEFYYQDALYSFHFRQKHASGYKWMVVINTIRGTDVFRDETGGV